MLQEMMPEASIQEVTMQQTITSPCPIAAKNARNKGIALAWRIRDYCKSTR